jgi:hypothetical protein
MLLSGKEPDKPWLFSLRREYLKYDPAHNPLGTWPLYAEEEYPAEPSPTEPTAQASTENGATDATPVQAQQASAPVARVGQGPLSAMHASQNAGESGASDAMDVDQKEGGAERVRTSKGWEDLTLDQKVRQAFECEVRHTDLPSE